ncbi:MAG: hypothetical protein AVDCRST_MAG89-3091, partial [uncultured Gemmatimonadetes bacterium]
ERGVRAGGGDPRRLARDAPAGAGGWALERGGAPAPPREDGVLGRAGGLLLLPERVDGGPRGRRPGAGLATGAAAVARPFRRGHPASADHGAAAAGVLLRRTGGGTM